MRYNELNLEKEARLAKEIMGYALKCGADAIRVTLNNGQQSSFSVMNGKLDKLQMTNDSSLYIQIYTQGRYGAFSTNRMERNELEHFVKEAIVATRLLAPDIHRKLPDPAIYYKGGGADLKQFDSSLFDIDSKVKKEIAFGICDEMSSGSDLVISATAEYADAYDYQYIVDTQGFEGESLETDFTVTAECSLKGKGDARPNSWWYETSLFFDKLNCSGCGKEAVSRGLKKLNPRSIKSGKYNMVVENRVASRLIAPIITALNGRNLQQKNSFLLNKIGEKVFSGKMNIIDTPHIPGLSGSRYFDGDGIATKDLSIIENGVVRTPFISSYFASMLNTDVTIEGPSVPTLTDSGYGEEYRNLTLDNMLSAIDNGILVTGFNGGNCNGTTGDFSYGIEGFTVKDGKMGRPLSEMLITGNMVDLWNSLLFSGTDIFRQSRWQIPSIAFEGVDFTGE